MFVSKKCKLEVSNDNQKINNSERTENSHVLYISFYLSNLHITISIFLL